MSVTAQARDLTRVPDEELLVAYDADRDPDVRDELVRRFIPFARKLALRYVHSREPLDDLVQVASDRGWSVHVPRELQERALAVSRQTERLSVRLGRSI